MSRKNSDIERNSPTLAGDPISAKQAGLNRLYVGTKGNDKFQPAADDTENSQPWMIR